MLILQIKIIAALMAIIALAAAVLGYGRHQYQLGVTHTTDRYEAAIQRQKTDAANTLAAETEKTRLLERALQAATHQQETQDAINQKTVAALTERLRTAAGFGLRLRDPNAAPAGCWPSGGDAQGAATAATADRAADAAETGGLLSEQITGLLQQLTREADDINAAYTSCRADAYAVRGEVAAGAAR